VYARAREVPAVWRGQVHAQHSLCLIKVEYAKFAESVLGHRPAAPNFYDNY
jgi:hypothetical protein